MLNLDLIRKIAAAAFLAGLAFGFSALPGFSEEGTESLSRSSNDDESNSIEASPSAELPGGLSPRQFNQSLSEESSETDSEEPAFTQGEEEDSSPSQIPSTRKIQGVRVAPVVTHY